MTRSALSLLVLALAAGCSAEAPKPGNQATGEVAAQPAAAEDVLARETREDLEAARQEVAELRARLMSLDDRTSRVYHETLDDIETARAVAADRAAKADQAPEDARHTLGRAAREEAARIRKATRRVAALAGEVKGDFEREADTVLEESRKEIDHLKAKSATLDEKARRENDRLVAGLEKDWDQANQALVKAKSSAGDTWKTTRHEVNHSLRKVRSALRAAGRELSH